MAIRKLTTTQQQEIVNAFKYSNVDKNDLALEYEVSVTTIHNVLADHGVIVAKARKTPNQDALLQYLAMHNVTSVEQLKGIVKDGKKHSAKRIFDTLPVTERIDWFTQSFVTAPTSLELKDFNDATPQSPNPAPQIRPVQ